MSKKVYLTTTLFLLVFTLRADREQGNCCTTRVCPPTPLQTVAIHSTPTVSNSLANPASAPFISKI